jgi:hypothetical protein
MRVVNDAAKRIIDRRIRCQMLQPPATESTERVVSQLVGIQAQDARWAPWIVGVRSKEATSADVLASLQQGLIVKSWVFRGTLHLVAAEDLAWLTRIVAPVVIRRNARRYHQLELSEKDFATAERLLNEALLNVSRLTRNEAKHVLQGGGLSAEGQRLPYLLQRASLEGLLRHGPDQESQTTFVLRESSANWRNAVDSRDELVRRLAHRYFASHGPATRSDLAWWSGLPAKEITAALTALIENQDIFHDKRSDLYWVEQEQSLEGTNSLMFLAPFDEYIVGYRDRALVLDPAYARQVNAGGGIIRPTLLEDGKIVGVWSHRETAESLLVSPTYFGNYRTRSSSSLDRAVERLSSFLEKDVRIE